MEAASIPQAALSTDADVAVNDYKAHVERLAAQLVQNGYCVVSLQQDASVCVGFAHQALSHALTLTKSSLTHNDGVNHAFKSLATRDLLEIVPRRDALADAALTPHLQTVGAQAAAAVHHVALAVLKAIAFSLHVPTYTFAASLLDDEVLQPGQQPSSLLHLISYKHVAAAEAAQAAAAADEHEDRGVLTVVSCEQPGLQVLSSDGWQDIRLQANEVAVLAGYTLHYATGGSIKTCKHRVHPGLCPAATPRTSLCYKLRARPCALVDPPALLRRGRAQLEARYRTCFTVAELMEHFNETHPRSVNGHRQPQQQGQLQRAAAAAAAPSAAASHAGSPRQPASKRQRTDGEINIILKGLEGSQMHFAVKSTTIMGKIFAVFHAKTGLERGTVKFLNQYFDRISDDVTVQGAELVDGDTIHAFKVQVGD